MFKEILAPLDHLEAKAGEKVYGVGINDAPYYTSLLVDGVTQYCPYYMRWKKMLATCYSVSQGSGSLRTVCDEWHSLMRFRRWMEKQSWEGKELIHWLKVPGATIYSPATCLFVTRKVRSLFPARERRSNGRPFGVVEKGGRYLASCSTSGNRRGYVGSYATMSEAVEAYLSTKKVEVVSVASSQKDPAVNKSIIGYFDYFCSQQRALQAR